MALSQRLDLRQTQTLVMTPQLQQAIKLLQLSNVELTEYVDRQIEQNPLLERDDGEGGVAAAAPPAPTPDRVGTDQLTRAETLSDAADSPLDMTPGDVWVDGGPGDAYDGVGEMPSAWSGRGGTGDFAEDGRDLEDTLTEETSLRDHLIGQINIDVSDPGDRLIALHLVDLLDDAGWLSADPDAVARRFGCSVARVEAVLRRLQRLDPPGIFARSLAECLALQLAERNRLDPAMQALLDNLPLVATRNFAGLRQRCGVDNDDLVDMLAELRTLNPKPATAFARDVAPTLVPDILMRRQPSGGWILELNSETLPRVLVNQRYVAEVSAAARGKADKDYVADCLAQANWLVRSLHQRATTILKVASEIVRQQERFFALGVAHLRPLILRDIADAIGMHESTVSRVTANKFIATPRGVFELKYFFTSAIQGADGQASHSAEAVRFRIKAMIDQEAADDVLSDDRIVELLRRDGIDIARRTVAKYREGMQIPSSTQRRRDKLMRRRSA